MIFKTSDVFWSVVYSVLAQRWCWTRSWSMLYILSWTEMCWSLPCLQKGICVSRIVRLKYMKYHKANMKFAVSNGVLMPFY